MHIIHYDGTKDMPYKDTADEYITVSYCDISDHRPPHQYYDMHITERKKGRADYYILFVINGSMTVTIDGREICADVGKLVLYYPHTPQKIVKKRADNPANYWVHFNGYAIPEILSQCGFSKSGVYNIGDTEIISEHFQRMILAQRLAKNKLHINAAFLQLMSKISVKSETMFPETPSEFAYADKVLKGIIQMEWEYVHPRKISEYAKLCGMSSGRFSVSFKKATGKTPQKFIEDIRIQKAAELLCSGVLSISRISESVGFRDPLYFSRVFKKNYGKSPTEYRRSGKASESENPK